MEGKGKSVGEIGGEGRGEIEGKRRKGRRET